MQEKKIFIKNKYNIKLCGILNEVSEEKSIAIICHARGSHKDSRATSNISKYLTKNNINNYRFDFTSDGESEGDALDVTDTKLYEDLESVLEYFIKKNYKEFILIGTSLGGRIVSLINTKKYNIQRIIMWYPAIFYRNKLQLLKNKLFRKKEEKIAKKEGYYLMHGRKKMSLEYLEQERKMNIFNNAINLNVETLIIHGNKDPFVDYRNSVMIHKKNKNVKLIIVENENHGFKINEKNLEYACNETIKFIME